jgi:hypothetical protein
MRKLLLGIAGAAALSLATAAPATVVLDVPETTVDATLDTDLSGITFAIGYHDAGLANPFEEVLQWTSDLAGAYDITLSTSTVIIDELFLSGPGGDTPIPLTFNSGSIFQFGLEDLNLGAGTYALHINGHFTGTRSSFGGDVNFNAVPEPATWAMMLLGFGAVGFSIRRRRTPALAQLA